MNEQKEYPYTDTRLTFWQSIKYFFKTGVWTRIIRAYDIETGGLDDWKN